MQVPSLNLRALSDSLSSLASSCEVPSAVESIDGASGLAVDTFY